jgi:hypothetical protein
MGYIPLIAIIFGARQKTCEQAIFDLTMSVRSNSDFYNFDDFRLEERITSRIRHRYRVSSGPSLLGMSLLSFSTRLR